MWVFANKTSTQCWHPSTLPCFTQTMVFEEWIVANTMLRIHCLGPNLLLSLPDTWTVNSKLDFLPYLTTDCSQSDTEQMGKNWILLLLHPSYFLPLFILHFWAVAMLLPLPTVSEWRQGYTNSQCTHTSKQFGVADQICTLARGKGKCIFFLPTDER